MFTKLSIIIPTYNNPKKLSRCLQSLSQQTVFNVFKNEVEIIVVDDGSTPPVVIPKDFVRSSLPTGASMLLNVKKLITLLNKMPPVRRHGGNIKNYRITHAGAPAARNFGWQKSTGQYVFFCDSDVVFLKPDALEKMLATLEKNPDKAYCYSSFKFGFKKFILFPFDADKLKRNNYISTMSLIRRSALNKILTGFSQGNFSGPFDESLKRFQDWDLWLALLKVGETGIFLPEILWQATTGGSMSNWFPKIFYKIFKNSAKVQAYKKAKEIIIKKHNL